MADATIRRSHGFLNPRNDLSVEEARAILSYDEQTGILRWKVSRVKIQAGNIATHRVGKGLGISYAGLHFSAHRVIWLLMTGEWPAHQIDHRDGDRSNNRWSNLRAATQSQNAVNRKYATTSPYRGVKRITYGRSSGKRWVARITVNKKRIILGYFGSAEEAYEAYKQAALKYHGEFATLT